VKKLALLLLVLTTPLFAQQVSVLRFDPPDPTSETGVHAHVHIPNFGCGITGATVTRSGSIIGIALQPSVVLCLVPSPADITVDLGVLPAGVYDVVVSPGQLLSAIAEAELDVRDGNPPFTVSPDTPGSATIDLVGNANLRGTTGVHFGTSAAEVVSVTANEVRVKVPVLEPGTYDVIVDTLPNPLRATAAYHVPKADTRNPAFYERVLFPVFWSGSGAFGSVWRTQVTIHNGNDFLITPPGLGILLPLGPTVTAIATADDTRPNGAVEILSRQANARVDIGLNVRDLSRDAQDLGTEIPVVRESQLYARPFSIASVPGDSRYRVTLRLYNLDGPTRFGIRVLSGSTEVLPFTAIVLNADASLQGGSFAVINDLAATYPQLAGKSSLRIEIDPLIKSGARAAWGFVSVTNNETQHVTVISPQ